MKEHLELKFGSLYCKCWNQLRKHYKILEGWVELYSVFFNRMFLLKALGMLLHAR